jgi:hypothetical protein
MISAESILSEELSEKSSQTDLSGQAGPHATSDWSQASPRQMMERGSSFASQHLPSLSAAAVAAGLLTGIRIAQRRQAERMRHQTSARISSVLMLGSLLYLGSRVRNRFFAQRPRRFLPHQTPPKTQ